MKTGRLSGIFLKIRRGKNWDKKEKQQTLPPYVGR